MGTLSSLRTTPRLNLMQFSESNPMRFVLFIISMLLLAGCGNSIDVTDLQEGDVVFIESQSSQSPYIKVVYPSLLE